MSPAPIKCPRCSAAITASPDEMGFFVCPSCGAKLRAKTPVVVKIQGAASPPPSPSTVQPSAGDIDSVLARLDSPPDPTATLPPGTPLKKIPRPGAPGAPSQTPIDAILTEVRTVRKLEEEILGLLRERGLEPASLAPADDEDEPPSPAPAVAPVRSRRRKTVLVVDDDEAARKSAVEALERAQVPVKAAMDGNGGLAAIASEKPDVIAIELGMGGSMGGKDVINMIKATMEWVDIPILLYTRVPIESQKEARTIHGADEFVLKGPGSPEALVAKVIQLFRRS